MNQCPHVGAPLEWIPDQFLDADAQFIQCAVHGAAFVIDDGACAGGPCNGVGLTALPLLQEGDHVKVDVTTVRELLAPSCHLMLSAILLIPLFILALRWANWSRMREQRLINVFLFSVLVVLLFWSLRIPVMEGVSWHVSGITFLTLDVGMVLRLTWRQLGGGCANTRLTRTANQCAQYDFAACGVTSHT